MSLRFGLLSWVPRDTTKCYASSIIASLMLLAIFWNEAAATLEKPGKSTSLRQLATNHRNVRGIGDRENRPSVKQALPSKLHRRA
jgi:hypothetical protein